MPFGKLCSRLSWWYVEATHMPRRACSSPGLERGHTAPAWGCWEERQVWSSPGLSAARGPGVPPTSSSLMLRMQSSGGFAKMRPDILQTLSNGTWTEQLALAISQYLSLVELLLPWWHTVLHKTEAFQTHPRLQFPWDRRFSARTDFFNLLPWIPGNVCGH